MNDRYLFRGKRIDDGEWIQSMTIAEGTIKSKRGNVYMELGDNNWKQIIPETIGQFTGLLDKNGVKIFEGDEISYRMPYRTTQTHTGDNIPNGSYTEPMEPGIKELGGIVAFSNGMFFIEDAESPYPHNAPLIWCNNEWDLESIKESISWTRQDAGWFDDPEEGDLQYLISEVAKVKDADELIKYLSGIEVIGNIHDK